MRQLQSAKAEEVEDILMKLTELSKVRNLLNNDLGRV
jgi:hypothetical protein